MPARKDTPAVVKHIVTRGYVRLGTATAELRLEPSFLLIGAQRCGTTSLFRAMAAHPQVIRPTFHKGVNYFDLNYYRGARWYRGHFPLAEIARRKTSRYSKPVAFEASGYYLYHPFALERAAHDLPAAKLVVMLRDPVERAFSAYKHEYARGFERVSFEMALELEDSRLEGELNRMRQDPGYESFSHRHHSYRHRGHYAEQLERAFAFFPRAQVHIIESAAYFRQPAREYAALLRFLELDPFEPRAFGRFNARHGSPMPAKTRQTLEAYFAPHDRHLTELLGHRMDWMSGNSPGTSVHARPAERETRYG